MPGTITKAAVALLGAFSAVSAFPFGWRLASRDVRGELPAASDPIEAKFQPVMDFDTDGCYNTAAIDKDGNPNPGSDPIAKGISQWCREQNRLEHNNVYSRRRCNNGVCAIMYEYYFEKDQVIWGSWGAGGHLHDWENVVVFVRGDKVLRVAPSCHGHYEHATNTPPLDGDFRPKVVYHKDGGGTHCIRIAKAEDERIENHFGVWFTGNLVGWDHWPSIDLRNKMLGNWPGGIGPKLDDEFAGELAEAASDQVPGFDPNIDG